MALKPAQAANVGSQLCPIVVARCMAANQRERPRGTEMRGSMVFIQLRLIPDVGGCLS